MDFISPCNAQQLDRIFALYARSFTKDEVEPEQHLRSMIASGAMDAYYISENDVFAGFALVFVYDDIALTMFLAVNEDMQSKGTGTAALNFIDDAYYDYVRVLEIEGVGQTATNTEQRKRREAFYLKNGYEYAGFSSMLYGTQLDVMVKSGSGTITPQEYMDVQKAMLSAKSFENIHLLK